ncbi:MAG: helix-turn-helix domain-containing protein [Candidatus Eremiobacteraeota bacterium]|nr:helix-turn-helix domain-containing protein [Candidatus Eremiobacteraeota bacterium]
MSFGPLLRQFRVAAGLTQEALAERAGVSADGIGALERGTNQAPQRDTLKLLIKALNLNIEEERALASLAIRSSRPRDYSRRRRATHDLPRALTPLLGREREIEEVARLLSASPLVTLIGTGGVGKTRLAIGVGEQLAQSFRDGVSFIDLAPLQDSDRVASVVASKLGIRESLDRPVLETLTEALRETQLLLILDNCEHLFSACAALADALVRGCDGIVMLATSRQPLDVPGEQTYRVASLAVPDDCESITATEALRHASVALFEGRARRAVKSFCITDANAAPISKICRRLDGIPFAIELAAARMKLMTPQQLEERLFERFDLLVGGSHLELPRHQTMRALIDWSYNLLTPEEQEFFTRLAVFTSDFSFEAVALVCADAAEPRTVELLASLVDKSLVTSEPRGAFQRYRLLETLRVYASEHFSGDRFELDHRHAQYYAALARDVRPADVARLDPDGENLHAALDWALERRGNVGLGITLLVSMRDFWLRSGLVAEPAHRAERARS